MTPSNSSESSRRDFMCRGGAVLFSATGFTSASAASLESEWKDQLHTFPECPPLEGVLGEPGWILSGKSSRVPALGTVTQIHHFEGKQLFFANAPSHDDSRGALFVYDATEPKKPLAVLELPRALGLHRTPRFAVSFDFDPQTGILAAGSCAGFAVLIRPSAGKTSLFVPGNPDKNQVTVFKPADENPFETGKEGVDSSRPLTVRFFRNPAGELKLLVIGQTLPLPESSEKNTRRGMKLVVFDVETGTQEFSRPAKGYDQGDQKLRHPYFTVFADVGGVPVVFIGSRFIIPHIGCMNLLTGDQIPLPTGSSFVKMNPTNGYCGEAFAVIGTELFVIQSGEMFDDTRNVTPYRNGCVHRINLESRDVVGTFEVRTEMQSESLAIDDMTLIPGTTCFIGIGQRGGIEKSDGNARAHLFFINPLTRQWGWTPLRGCVRRSAFSSNGDVTISPDGRRLFVSTMARNFNYITHWPISLDALPRELLGRYPSESSSDGAAQPAPRKVTPPSSAPVPLADQPFRVWTRAADGKTVEARCVQIDSVQNRLQLAKRDDSRFWMPLADLSSADQRAVRALLTPSVGK